ncbi:MAG: DUF1580 domain-containing protein [Planctomycetota bacterium]
MSIDTFKETILSVDAAAKHISKITGKRRNRAVILRWANKGVAGVKLRTIAVGSEIFTSREALNDFLNDSRNAKRDQRSRETASGIRRSKLASNFQAEELGI